ncbi:MAG: DUF3108 domain-containing protein [Bacteroidales bacterium]
MNLEGIMNFNIRTFYFALLMLLLCGPIKAQRANSPYKDGESLTYVINYRWGSVNTDVGEAVTSLTYNNGIFHSIIKGRTYKFYDVFFKVREHFESKFYEYPMRPYYFYRDTYEGKYRMRNTFYFNNTDYNIKARIQRYEDLPKDTILTGKEHTFDLVALFYNVRNINFEATPIGVKQPISFAIDDDVFNFYYVYEGKEIKKISGIGTFRTLKFAVKLVAGSVFTGKEEMVVWVTDDNNKIPLLFESPILVGKVSGRLSKWVNLKYSLTSKIK